MKVAIIDADLIHSKYSHFPNLSCLKLGGYFKQQGADVDLKLDYGSLEYYDKVFISKVFTDTPCPPVDNKLFRLPANIEYGGTGFFYDKAPPLQYDIEHTMPDYTLYDKWVTTQLEQGVKPSRLKYFKDYSVGFCTRGCVRGCSNCVNRNYRECLVHSPVSEFLDEGRKYICLLDDNVFACKDWRQIFESLNATGKPFQFKQGLDIRFLNKDKVKVLLDSNWIGDLIFAFDNIKNKAVVEKKLALLREYTNKQIKIYVFCAYNHTRPDHYTPEFWKKDIEDLFERVRILIKYDCKPYIMKYKDYKLSPYFDVYTALSRWCNQPSLFHKSSLRDFSKYDLETGCSSTVKCLQMLEKVFPHLMPYFDMKVGEL